MLEPTNRPSEVKVINGGSQPEPTYKRFEPYTTVKRYPDGSEIRQVAIPGRPKSVPKYSKLKPSFTRHHQTFHRYDREDFKKDARTASKIVGGASLATFLGALGYYALPAITTPILL